MINNNSTTLFERSRPLTFLAIFEALVLGCLLAVAVVYKDAGGIIAACAVSSVALLAGVANLVKTPPKLVRSDTD